jgi:hypothetical protein
MTSNGKSSPTIIVIDDSDDDQGNDHVDDQLETRKARATKAKSDDNNSDTVNDNDEKVQSLMAIMNIPQSKARATLESCDFNLERAIAHLLDPPQPQPNHTHTHNQQNHTHNHNNHHQPRRGKEASLKEIIKVAKPHAQKSLFADDIVDITASNENEDIAAVKGTTTTTTTTMPKLSQQWHECYQRTIQTRQDYFVDSDFAPTTSSLDGRWRKDESKATNSETIKCLCGLPAAPRTVQSDGPNYGRFYLACGQQQRGGGRARRAPVVVVRSPSDSNKDNNNTHGNNITNKQEDDDKKKPEVVWNPYAKNKKDQQQQQQQVTIPSPPKSPPQRSSCNFFRWDPDGSSGAAGYRTRYSLLAWQHFGQENHCCLFRQSIDPSQVRQGAVGNCWFLSALAVVAEKPHLVRQLLPHDGLNDKGCYQVNLCLDGKWTPVIVDSNLPVVLQDVSKQGKKSAPTVVSQSTIRGGVPYNNNNNSTQGLVAYPAFCAAPNHQLWPGLVEKAYAKAHGSYAQLSGGFIAEGLTDLTGGKLRWECERVQEVQVRTCVCSTFFLYNTHKCLDPKRRMVLMRDSTNCGIVIRYYNVSLSHTLVLLFFQPWSTIFDSPDGNSRVCSGHV